MGDKKIENPYTSEELRALLVELTRQRYNDSGVADIVSDFGRDAMTDVKTIKLTSPQKEALLALVAYQQQATEVPVFWCYSEDMPNDGIYVYPINAYGHEILIAPPEYVFLWERMGLVVTGTRKGRLSFILRQEAFDWAAAIQANPSAS